MPLEEPTGDRVSIVNEDLECETSSESIGNCSSDELLLE